ncbi:hypothetical protein BaRGS_00024185 [Batillaria attramentaria]|uniref:Solute carrier family 28 member 3 n=1 Tax=Batillaria attramentaria TaxID=370345 RepID=A0ABD0KBS4_9CAEN
MEDSATQNAFDSTELELGDPATLEVAGWADTQGVRTKLEPEPRVFLPKLKLVKAELMASYVSQCKMGIAGFTRLDHLNATEKNPSQDEESLPRKGNSNSGCSCRNETVCFPLIALRGCLGRTFNNSKRPILVCVKYLCYALFLVYVGFSLKHEFGSEASVRLLVCTLAVVLGLVCRRVCAWCTATNGKRTTPGGGCRECCRPCRVFYTRHSTFINGSLVALVLAGIVYFLVVDVALRRPASLVSAAGIAVLVVLTFLGSHAPKQVRWRTVGWGLLLQFIFALLVLRTTWGRAAFKWLAARMTEYMNYTDSGAAFVFGPSFRDHFFAFRVMSTIIFFSASISILYYFGVMQVVIKAVSKVMQVTMGTGAMETLHAAINIFCGWAESLMVVRPFLESMTLPELHAVMTNGFATVAGSTIAAYISYGVPANHLISASFMSAPAALALSKISFPSDCRARKRVKVDDIPRHILVTVIAFISLLAFVNATLEWFGARIGLVPPDYPPLSFQLICSYLMWPVAFLLGVRMPDCRVVARLIGIKIFVNEFVAYADLGTVRANRLALENHVMNNGTWRFLGVGDDVELLGTNTTLLGGVISPRSETLATYALCGFSDLVALGMMTAALSTVAPSRRPHVLQVAPRALITGITACLLTAAMAGLLVEE